MIGFSKRAWLDNVVGVPDSRWPGPLQLMLRVLGTIDQLDTVTARAARSDS